MQATKLNKINRAEWPRLPRAKEARKATTETLREGLNKRKQHHFPAHEWCTVLAEPVLPETVTRGHRHRCCQEKRIPGQAKSGRPLLHIILTCPNKLRCCLCLFPFVSVCSFFFSRALSLSLSPGQIPAVFPHVQDSRVNRPKGSATTQTFKRRPLDDN